MPYNLSQLRRQRSNLAGLNDVMDQQLNGIEGRLGIGQRPSLRDRMQQFDMRQAQQNSLGRLQAGRQSQFGAMVPPDNGMLANRVNSALSGSPLATVPPEQQSFVASQMRQPAPMMGQSQGLAGYRPQLGNPWYDPAPVPRPQGNAYGLQAQRNFVPGDVAPVGNGVLGTIGNSTLQRIDGRNVLVGNRTEIPEGGLRAMQRAAAENASAPVVPKSVLAARQDRGARNNALRRAATDRRLSEMGSPPIPQNQDLFATPGAPLPTDKAAQHLAKNAATDVWAMNGINAGNIAGASGSQLLGAMDSDVYRNMSPEARRKAMNDVEAYIAANPNMDKITQEELRGVARGDQTARKAAAAKRQQRYQQQQNQSYETPPLMLGG